jgi:nitrogen fixation/metabolism regulation signal transduction histidine kinase
MIRITIKVSNDHCHFTEHFETTQISLGTDDEQLTSMIEKVIKSFNQPVEQVIVKTKMEV